MQMKSPADISMRTAWTMILLLWLACAAVLTWSMWGSIVPMDFNDPDDAMRFVEVRDWLNGQSWFDVTQYRSEPPHGAPMHWSRLVDIPIALLIRLAGLFLPLAQAERVALVAAPLLTLLVLTAVLLGLGRQATGRRGAGVLAAAMLMLSLSILVQFRPLRIDHHGWQIVLGGIAVLFMLRAIDGRSGRYALLAGLAAALSLVVAIEGVPLVATIGAVFGLLYLSDVRAARLLTTYLATLTVGGAAMMLATLGWPAMTVPWCDALSPAYMLPFLVATTLFAGGSRLLPQHDWRGRLAALGMAALGAALAFRLASPICAAGPFAALDPLLARLWYRGIAEGMPIWTQPLDIRVLLPVPSVLGLVGALWAIRVDDARRREGWIALLIVQVVAFLVSLIVLRAMGLAHFLALPATAWMVLRLLSKAQALITPVARIIASVACFAITPFGAEALVVAALPDNAAEAGNGNAATDSGARSACIGYAALRGIDALPPSELFAPLDIGAHLLAYTHHSVIATGHHRAQAGMKTVVSAFIAPPAQAHTIVAGTGARYVVLCSGENEVGRYARLYPASLSAALLKKRTPDWLTPVPMPRGGTIRVWRIVR
jgi:hypothetical protein